MARTATRVGAVAALAVATAAVVVAVLVLAGGSDGRPGTSAAGAGAGRASSATGRSSRPAAASLDRDPRDEVRNSRPQPDWKPYAGAVPIFQYHVVGDPRPEEAYPERFVAPADFSAQMDWLQRHGYQAVTLDLVERAWFGGGTLPAKPVVVAFDGVRGALLAHVFPDLSRRGWPGEVVLDAAAPPARDADLTRLLKAGWEPEAQAARPATPPAALERRLGVPVRNFSFGIGAGEAAQRAAVRAAGYTGATVPTPGFASPGDPYRLARVPVFGLSRIDGFVEAIESRGRGAGA